MLKIYMNVLTRDANACKIKNCWRCSTIHCHIDFKKEYKKDYKKMRNILTLHKKSGNINFAAITQH